jgi:hypothetical protein
MSLRAKGCRRRRGLDVGAKMPFELPASRRASAGQCTPAAQAVKHHSTNRYYATVDSPNGPPVSITVNLITMTVRYNRFKERPGFTGR